MQGGFGVGVEGVVEEVGEGGVVGDWGGGGCGGCGLGVLVVDLFLQALQIQLQLW
jgi:hypothetical protein